MASIISVIFGLIELVIGLRFIFRFLGANPSAPFVAWIYDMSQPLIAPFEGIFSNPVLTPGSVVHSVFEPSTLLALIIYAAIGGVLIELLGGQS